MAQNDPITTSGIDRYGDATVTQVDHAQIAADATREQMQGPDPSLRSPEMTSANEC